jgi:hypothetical protein
MPSISNIAGRLQDHWNEHGFFATLGLLGSKLLRYQITSVVDADLRTPLPPVEWVRERVLIVDRDNVDSVLGPSERSFLAGADELIHGVRSGDRLFLVADGEEYLHRSYVMMSASNGKKLIGEAAETPLIGYAYTSAAARGRGLFRRALAAELCYLQKLGFKRALFEFHPDNTPSKKGSEAAGFRFVKTVSVWTVMSLFALQRAQTNNGTRWRLVFL